jgi:hypothetical protein
MKTKAFIVLLAFCSSLFAAPADSVDACVDGLKQARSGDFIPLTDRSDLTAASKTYRVVDLAPGIVMVQNSTGEIKKTFVINRALTDMLVDRYAVSFVRRGQQAYETNKTWWYLHGI